MKSPSSTSPTSRSSRRLTKVRCSFCGNTFYADPREAICRKCNRPANRPMSLGLRVAAFLIPPFGFGYSVLIRPHSPFAAGQGFVASALGLALDVAIYFITHRG